MGIDWVLRLSRLPLEIRQMIYGQLLELEYHVFIFSEKGNRVECFSPGKPGRWLALFYVNRRVSVEARAVLYGGNRFLMEGSGNGRVTELFLRMIGRENAGYMRAVCIHFPEVDRALNGGICGDSGRSALRLAEGSVRQLDILVEYCVGLRMLEVLVYGVMHVPCMSFEEEDEGSCVEKLKVLGEIDGRMRRIGKVEWINVWMYGSSSNGRVLDYMGRLGWTLWFGGVPYGL